MNQRFAYQDSCALPEVFLPRTSSIDVMTSLRSIHTLRFPGWNIHWLCFQEKCGSPDKVRDKAMAGWWAKRSC